MTNIFGETFQPTLGDSRKWQGRSKKKLKPVIEHDGRVWVARYKGRAGRFFAATRQNANNNLQAGAA